MLALMLAWMLACKLLVCAVRPVWRLRAMSGALALREGTRLVRMNVRMDSRMDLVLKLCSGDAPSRTPLKPGATCKTRLDRKDREIGGVA